MPSPLHWLCDIVLALHQCGDSSVGVAVSRGPVLAS